MAENIIINGVDVSGCECFYINDSHPERKECINPYCKGLCKDNPNCCFKQLKRKGQEWEKVKNWVKGMMFYTDCSNWFERFTTAFEDWKNDLISQLDQLKTENDGLKDDIEGLKRNLLDKENCSARYYLITSHREWNEMYKKIDYQRDKKEQAEQKLKFVENVLSINYQLWMYYIANGINNSSNHTILDLIEDFATSVRLLANTLDIKDNTLNYYTKDSIVYDKKNKELQKLNNEVRNAKND